MWAHVTRGYRLRSVTLRPRTSGVLGRTVSGQLLWRSQDDYVLAAGPVAETEYFARAGLLTLCSWEDALSECLYLDGGVSDRNKMLTTTYVEPGPGLDGLRTSITADWRRITVLAEELLAATTLSGDSAAATLQAGRRLTKPLPSTEDGCPIWPRAAQSR